ncbi:MAG: hypothetical protein ACK5LN_04870 [Propioniciclava sp.]
MHPPIDPLTRIRPPVRCGDRVSLRVEGTTPPGATEIMGFVLCLTASHVTLIDRQGEEHQLPRAALSAARRIPVARGRNPLAAPAALLDDLAARADAVGQAWVIRITELLAQQPPPAQVPAWGATAAIRGTRVRIEGEWATLQDGDPDTWTAAGWWATRGNARSLQVRASTPAINQDLQARGFSLHLG